MEKCKDFAEKKNSIKAKNPTEKISFLETLILTHPYENLANSQLFDVYFSLKKIDEC
jgi:hypothetical protein